ncbi:MAG: nuclear transport factor 2 family protein, partial [Actinomycetota bacterium]
IDDPDEGWIRQSIIYRDTYERRDGRWLFVRRRHHLVYGQRDERDPLDQPAANWPERQIGRGTDPRTRPR